MKEIYFISALVVLLGAFIYWILPSTRWRVFGTLGYVLFGAGLYLTSFEMLGLPKPLYLEWRKLNNAKVISFFWIENKAIYLWLMVDNEPRQYALPWSTEQAQQMQDAQEKASGDGGDGELLFSDEGEEGDDKPKFRIPPKYLPPKDE